MTEADRPLPHWQESLRGLVRKRRVVALKLRMGRRQFLTGSDFAIGAKAVFATQGPIRFGNRVHVGRDFHCETSLAVGDDVLISSRVAFIGNDHDFDDPDRTVFSGRRNPRAHVVIEGDCLVGFGSVVIGSVRIGRGAIVGAHSVVTTDIPPGWVAVGAPAKPIRRRYTQGTAK